MLRYVDKHFQDGSVELQIPPLRFAPVGMTHLFGLGCEYLNICLGLGWWCLNSCLGLDVDTQTEVSSRPERSVVEGPAVYLLQ